VRRVRLPVRPNAKPCPIDDLRWARSSANRETVPMVSLSGVARSRYLLPPRFVDAGSAIDPAFVKLVEAKCLLIGKDDCAVGERSGNGGCWETYSRGEFLIRPISVVALEGARNRESSSSSGSSVAPRRLRSSKEVRLPPTELCVGVPTSEGA